MKIQCEIASSRLRDSDEHEMQKPRGGWGETSSHRLSLVRFFTARPLLKFFARLQSPRAEHRLSVKVVWVLWFFLFHN